jgi:hypothetical protein
VARRADPGIRGWPTAGPRGWLGMPGVGYLPRDREGPAFHGQAGPDRAAGHGAGRGATGVRSRRAPGGAGGPRSGTPPRARPPHRPAQPSHRPAQPSHRRRGPLTLRSPPHRHWHRHGTATPPALARATPARCPSQQRPLPAAARTWSFWAAIATQTDQVPAEPAPACKDMVSLGCDPDCTRPLTLTSWAGTTGCAGRSGIVGTGCSGRRGIAGTGCVGRSGAGPQDEPSQRS